MPMGQIASQSIAGAPGGTGAAAIRDRTRTTAHTPNV